MTIKLSICIPTYNRSACLKEAIESVLPQMASDVEIVISDNASTDDTESVVRSFQRSNKNIVYHRNSENLGADRNFLKVIDVANGEYCWFLGSDDALAEDSIKALREYLGKSDIYLTDRRNMSFDMKVIISDQAMLLASDGQIFDCSNAAELSQYFESANTIASLFSYISSVIIKRDIWQNQPTPEELIGSCWIHVAKAFLMMRAGASIQYVAKPLVLNRTGNDSFFVSVGYTNRRLIDLRYPRIAELIFGCDSVAYIETVRVLASQFFTYRAILSDKRSAILADSIGAERLLVAAYQKYFKNQPGYYLKIMALYLSGGAVLSTIRIIFGKNADTKAI